MQVAIIDYGAGNVFSVQQAFRRLGIEPVVTADKLLIATADRVVFPGVGHAKAAMEQLRKQELDVLIPQLQQPVLGICLGMQLLCQSTEEGNVSGLGVFDTTVSSFTQRVVVPHMGWNDVRFPDEQQQGVFYFVHSFKAGICADTWGVCDYDEPFSAALKKNNFTGVQFHPEKSGAAGEGILTHFLATI